MNVERQFKGKKEIADAAKTNVHTVTKWIRFEGLPVFTLPHDKAYRIWESKLLEWMNEKACQAENDGM